MDKGSADSRFESEDRLLDGEVDDESVENFSFDVSPNIRNDDSETAQSHAPASGHRRPRRRQSVSTFNRADTPGTASNATEQKQPPTRLSKPGLAEIEVSRKQSVARPNKKVRRQKAPRSIAARTAIEEKSAEKKESIWKRRPAWTLSLGVHAFAILLMSVLGFVVAEPDDFLLWANLPPSEPLEEFQEIEIESPLDLEELDAEMPTELEDAGMANLGELSADSPLVDLSKTGPLAGDSVGEWGSLFGEEGSGLADMGLGQGNALTSFFGTKSDARRVVFVIDNTGSMRTGGLETVIVEMMKTVGQFDPRQEFYVLFFSDQVYPLFFPESTEDFVRPTERNKQKLQEWLDTVEFCTGGVWQLTQALDTAYRLKPDVVYLLTDGRHWDAVRADYKVEAVKQLRSEPNRLGIPIHTLGMGCETDFDRDNLRQVAQANGGSFQEVRVSPAMIDVAHAKNRPYHIHGPGTIWGTLVRQRNYAPREPAP